MFRSLPRHARELFWSEVLKLEASSVSFDAALVVRCARALLPRGSSRTSSPARRGLPGRLRPAKATIQRRLHEPVHIQRSDSGSSRPAAEGSALFCHPTVYPIAHHRTPLDPYPARGVRRQKTIDPPPPVIHRCMLHNLAEERRRAEGQRLLSQENRGGVVPPRAITTLRDSLMTAADASSRAICCCCI